MHIEMCTTLIFAKMSLKPFRPCRVELLNHATLANFDFTRNAYSNSRATGTLFTGGREMIAECSMQVIQCKDISASDQSKPVVNERWPLT